MPTDCPTIRVNGVKGCAPISRAAHRRPGAVPSEPSSRPRSRSVLPRAAVSGRNAQERSRDRANRGLSVPEWHTQAARLGTAGVAVLLLDGALRHRRWSASGRLRLVVLPFARRDGSAVLTRPVGSCCLRSVNDAQYARSKEVCLPHDRQENREWVRYSSLGVELAAAVVGCLLLGLWIDRHFGTSPWGTVVCILLGLIGGLFNLVRGALAAVQDSGRAGVESDDADGV